MAQRPERKRAPKTQYEAKNTSWKLKDKKALLRALKIHSPNDITALQKEVKTKSIEEVGRYVERIKKGAMMKHRNVNKKSKAPIEDWLQLLKDLTAFEKKDYTESLGRVLSIAGNFEDHPPPSVTVPDYSAIYKYLSALLLEKELPILGALESAVILDLLHSLADVLRTHDTFRQQQVMEYKYQLLTCKVNTLDPAAAVVKARKALENDFSDFESSQTTGQNHNSTNQLTSISSDNQSNDSDLAGGQQQTTVSRETITPSTSSSSANESQTTAQSTNNTSETDAASGSSFTGYLSNDSNNQNLETAEILAMSGVENVEGELGTVKQKKRKRTFMNPATCPKKPALFTMNPFCIPVNLLKMKTIFEKTKEMQKISTGQVKQLPQIIPRKNFCAYTAKKTQQTKEQPPPQKIVKRNPPHTTKSSTKQEIWVVPDQSQGSK